MNEKIKNEIISLVARGGTLRMICKTHSHIDYLEVIKALKSDEDFNKNFLLAKKDYADYIVDEIISIADDISLKPQDKQCRIAARQWIAAKLKSEYSDSGMAGVEGRAILNIYATPKD